MIRNPDVPVLLDHERALLDSIFGEGEYQIESSHPQEAAIRFSRFKLALGYDARDGSIASTLTLTEPWGEELDDPQGWARFLGEEPASPPRNSLGQVTLGPEEQIRAELKLVARLSRDIFSDPQKTRDAVNFVRGYRTAYNEWARGAWS